MSGGIHPQYQLGELYCRRCEERIPEERQPYEVFVGSGQGLYHQPRDKACGAKLRYRSRERASRFRPAKAGDSRPRTRRSKGRWR